MSKIFNFKTSSGRVFSLEESFLKKYEDSFLSTMALSSFGGDRKDGFVNVGTLSDNTMEHITYFYEKGVWKNPYLLENKWSIPFCEQSFEHRCLFLGLDPIIGGDSHEESEEDMWTGMKYEEDELEEIKREYKLDQFLEVEEKIREEFFDKQEEEEVYEFYPGEYDDYYNSYNDDNGYER
jgi:hypothetical protein